MAILRKTPKPDNLFAFLTWLLIAVYVFAFSWFSFLQFRSFSFDSFDFSIYALAIRNILYGSLSNTLLGINIFGAHAALVLFLLAPIYFVFSSPLILLFIQALLLGVSAYPIFRIAGYHLDSKLALVIVVLYLMYPGLQYTNLYEFHPTALATCFLSFMLFFFHFRQFREYIIFAFLSLICQENMAFAIIMLSILAMVDRRGPKWTVLPLLVSVTYFLSFAILVVPHFSAGTMNVFLRYGHLGRSFGEILSNMVYHPVKIAEILFSSQNNNYLCNLFFPLCFLPLIGWEGILLIVPFLLQHMLSIYWFERTIQFHYTAELIPFIFFAFIIGLRRIHSLKRVTFVLITLAIILTVAACYNGPWKNIRTGWPLWNNQSAIALKREALSSIPDFVPVTATYGFQAHLINRKELYSFHHIYMGYYTLSSTPYKLPSSVNYALVDFNDERIFKTECPSCFPNLNDFIAQGWGVEDVWNSVILFRKNGSKGKYKLYEKFMISPSIKSSANVEVSDGMFFSGFDKSFLGNKTLKIVLLWHATRPINRDITRVFYLKNGNGKIVDIIPINLIYRLYPTFAWIPGEWIKEYVYIRVPDDPSFREGGSIEMKFEDIESADDLHHLIIPL